MDVCKNCGQPVEHNFCSYCGQTTHVERITLAYLLHELFHFFTHIEKGFLFTTWRMVTSPAQVVLDYVKGKRVKYQSPIPYFLIWTSLFVLTLYLFTHFVGELKVIRYADYFGPGVETTFAISNLSFMLAFIIPIQALYLFILITRPTYNYFETLAMAIYAVGTIIFFQFVFALLCLLRYLITGGATPLIFSDTFKFGFLVWFTISFLRAFKTNLGWLRGPGFMLLAAGTFLLWRLVVVPWVAGCFAG